MLKILNFKPKKNAINIWAHSGYANLQNEIIGIVCDLCEHTCEEPCQFINEKMANFDMGMKLEMIAIDDDICHKVFSNIIESKREPIWIVIDAWLRKHLYCYFGY